LNFKPEPVASYTHTGVIMYVLWTECSSKDSTVKLWDLDSQHCFKTLVGHSREVGSYSS